MYLKYTSLLIFYKMFYWQAKSSAKTLQIHNLWGVKMVFMYPKDGMEKNCLKSFCGSTEHWNGENSNSMFGLPLNSNNLGGQKWPFLPQRQHG